MTAEPDYYAVLGVAPDSEDVVIQAAFRALMRRYHPDVNSSDEAVRRATAINAAYGVLNDANAGAAYDRRRSSSSRKHQPPPPPPPPPNEQARNEQPIDSPKVLDKRPRPIKGFYAALAVLGFIGIAAATSMQSNTGTTGRALPIMNVDANPGNAQAVASLAVANTAPPAATPPTSLATQPETPVDYSSVERGANQLATLFLSKGVQGARAYSEHCHGSIKTAPTWEGADECAAFDFAAAFVDQRITHNAGWPINGYFQFQRDNQSDQYAAIGAASYVVTDRLVKIRTASEQAADEVMTARLAMQQQLQQQQQAGAAQVNASANLPSLKVVPEGVFLKSEIQLGNGLKRCTFDNGLQRVIVSTADCFKQ